MRDLRCYRHALTCYHTSDMVSIWSRICVRGFVVPGVSSRLNARRRAHCTAAQTIGRGEIEVMVARRDPHYRGDYDARARRLVAAANADPFTLCWRCKRTLAEHAPHKTGKPARWTAGHVIDGNPASPLLPEASTCNYTAGAELGIRKQLGSTKSW